METVTRSGRAVQGFALGEVAHGGGGHGGGGHHGGGSHGGGHGGFARGRSGLPGAWGWWGTPYVPDAEAQPVGDCAGWGAPVVMPSGMAMAAQAALGASNHQPTVARGPDGVLYRFSVENSEIVVRPCVNQTGALGDSPALPPLGSAGWQWVRVPMTLDKTSAVPVQLAPFGSLVAMTVYQNDPVNTDISSAISQLAAAGVIQDVETLTPGTRVPLGTWPPEDQSSLNAFRVRFRVTDPAGFISFVWTNDGQPTRSMWVWQQAPTYLGGANQVGALGDGPSTGLAGVDVRVSPAFASIMAGAAAGLLAHVLHAPTWGAILTGGAVAMVTNVGIDKTA